MAPKLSNLKHYFVKIAHYNLHIISNIHVPKQRQSRNEFEIHFPENVEINGLFFVYFICGERIIIFLKLSEFIQHIFPEINQCKI